MWNVLEWAYDHRVSSVLMSIYALCVLYLGYLFITSEDAKSNSSIDLAAEPDIIAKARLQERKQELRGVYPPPSSGHLAIRLNEPVLYYRSGPTPHWTPDESQAHRFRFYTTALAFASAIGLSLDSYEIVEVEGPCLPVF